MKLHKLCLMALVCVWSVGAMAQWQWVDKDGRKVFSDRPPPVEIPEKNILRQPHQRLQPASPPQIEADAQPDAIASTAKPTLSIPTQGVDKELEERKAKAEAEKATKEKEEEQKNSTARAENCTRARQAKARLDSGQLMKHTNTKGEQVFMDDAARAAERKRAQATIDSDCKP